MAVGMTPVDRRLEPVVRGGRRRNECWGAVSRDGRWCYERAADPDTRWYVIHNPTGWTISGGHSSLPRARCSTAASADALLDLWLDAYRVLHLPEDDTVAVTDHDRARAVLTWLAQHEPEVLAAGEELAESRRLRDVAARLRDVSDDLLARHCAGPIAEILRTRVLREQTIRDADNLTDRATALTRSARHRLAG